MIRLEKGGLQLNIWPFFASMWNFWGVISIESWLVNRGSLIFLLLAYETIPTFSWVGFHPPFFHFIRAFCVPFFVCEMNFDRTKGDTTHLPLTHDGSMGRTLHLPTWKPYSWNMGKHGEKTRNTHLLRCGLSNRCWFVNPRVRSD